MSRRRRYSSYLVDKDGEVISEEHRRKRRGKIVKIPEEWVGQVAHPQTKRKRYSKMPPKQKDAHCRAFGRSDKTMDYIKHKRGDDRDWENDNC